MLTEKEVEVLLDHAYAKRDKARREGHHETWEWWEGYRSAIQLVLGERIPKSIQADVSNQLDGGARASGTAEITEGKIKKGGVGKRPTTPRPSPPSGQCLQKTTDGGED